jgi:hypothetical protein
MSVFHVFAVLEIIGKLCESVFAAENYLSRLVRSMTAAHTWIRYSSTFSDTFITVNFGKRLLWLIAVDFFFLCGVEFIFIAKTSKSVLKHYHGGTKGEIQISGTDVGSAKGEKEMIF